MHLVFDFSEEAGFAAELNLIMEINRLLNDEITYELQIRGLPTSGTVATKRAILRDALRLERNCETDPPISVDLDINSELVKCNDKLGDLEEDIQNFNRDNAQNEFKRISSRLSHITLRLYRLQCDSSSEEKRDFLIGWCKNLNDILENIMEQPILDVPPLQQPSQSLIDEPLLLIPEIVCQPSQIREKNQFTEIRSAIRSNEDGLRVPNLLEANITQSRRSTLQQSHSTHEEIQRTQSNHDRFCKHNSVKFQEPLKNSFNQNDQPFHSTGRESHQPIRFGGSLGKTVISSASKTDNNYSNRVNSTMDLSTQLRNLQFSPPQYGTTTPYATSVNERCDIHRWGIKYDGQSSLSTFLERLEEIRQSRGVTESRLLQSAVELFEKDALLWYRMNKFTSWEDLVEKLRDAFQPYDYENALWDEIRRRTQGAHEKVISFVSVMESLFRRLPTKPSENERIRIIRRNMLPYIQTQMSLHSVESLQDLIRTARIIEETEWRVQKFSPPPTNSRNLVEPELAYRHRQSHVSAAPINTEVKPEIHSESKQSLCWNCGGNGHKFKKCDKPRKIFCFRCGKHNVTSLKCPECTKNSKARQQADCLTRL